MSYKTKARIGRMGRRAKNGNPKALVVFLEDANLEATVAQPHMTLLFSNDGFSSEDEERAIGIRNEWMREMGVGKISFDTQEWGRHSDLIKGGLEHFCYKVREEFDRESDSQRKPHVALRGH
eukprot:CAMPEP_0174262072 /NCGR_PEP_ID=MMETSP0439-20130205/12756_1 /TAXON_ID=0 /ORGANISM="Stereomyxa ramosa, Strain Chinc5" /LENGTH=121 /DNA_ID=CAMNT_0015346707 /DNA_START=60 /DNA_END=425 /DNA_ORIENTATION=+